MQGNRLILLAALALIFVAACTTHTTQPQQLPALVFDPPGGSYLVGQTITITCSEENAQIHWTSDGSEPTQQSALYTVPLAIPAVFQAASMSGTIKARAFKTGWDPSPIASSTYTTAYAVTVATPQITPEEGAIESGSLITISCATPDAEIRYTLDGSDPETSSLLYSDAFHVLQTGGVLIKARAFKPGHNPSPITASLYQVSANELVRVQGGTFNNGTGDVTISSFYLGKYEVTQEQYLAVMEYDPASAYGDGPDYPIYEVSWLNAIEYCNRLSMLNSLEPCYRYSTYGTDPSAWPAGWDTNTQVDNHNNVLCDWTANGFRLPTEMEWMFAAGGGIRSRGLVYAGSADLNEAGWWLANSGNTTHPTGLKLPNELGIYDLSGNVREWVWNVWWGSYPTEPQTDPVGPLTGSTRMNRGGGWASAQDHCRIDSRTSNNPTYTGTTTGFRICCRY